MGVKNVRMKCLHSNSFILQSLRSLHLKKEKRKKNIINGVLIKKNV